MLKVSMKGFSYEFLFYSARKKFGHSITELQFVFKSIRLFQKQIPLNFSLEINVFEVNFIFNTVLSSWGFALIESHRTSSLGNST